MISKSISTNTIALPLVIGEFAMIPFDLNTLDGLPDKFKATVGQMIEGIKNLSGTAFFTFHGKQLKKGETLRRGGPHTDGNYEEYNMTFGGGGGGNGWKVGENGPAINTELHHRQYVSDKGGIILASNYEACLGWEGEYSGMPGVGGDCRKIELDKPFLLDSNRVYYANNHFIHESLPMSGDVHRVFARITLPEDHEFSVN